MAKKITYYKDDNLTGTRQGSLLIGEPFRKNGRTYYHVKCDCSKEYDILRSNLLGKNYKNCKCHGMAIDPNRKYGMLQPTKRMPDGKWKCMCDCGNSCYAAPGALHSGGVKSCGCKIQKRAVYAEIRSDNKSGVKGVFHDVKRSGKWIAYINKNGKRTYLGRYDTKDLAVEAREEAERKFDEL